MHNIVLSLTCLFLVSCNASTLTPAQTSLARTPEYDREIKQLIVKDADNKKWSRLILQEIDIAIKNDDYDAYIFFIDEYMKIPKEIVPPGLRDEPGYVEPISDLESKFRINIHLPATDKPCKPIPPHAQ